VVSDTSPDAYARLADALDRLPNAFPRTRSGVELRILGKIFSPDEAALACLMTGTLEPFESIAERAGVPVAEVSRKLFAMAKKGLVWFGKKEGKPRFRLAAFIVGIFEAQVEIMDHELAHLVEEYLAEGGAAGIMKPQPALHRVVPARGSVKTEWILPYDDVKAMLLAAKSFTVHACICRTEQDSLGGRTCAAPVHNCLTFSPLERPARADGISQEEAMAILGQAEDAGLVHTVSNIAEGVSYVCNCCGCCCAILRGITEFGIEKSVARANYVAVIDSGLCTGCGVCVERCQVGAITESGGKSLVSEARCIGCGLCVTGCTHDAVTLSRLPDAQAVHPPADYETWERERLIDRGQAPISSTAKAAGAILLS
jgi:ferredoxin